MRKLLVLPCLLLLFVAATSCSDDNDDQKMMETAPLVGKWNEVNYNIEYFTNGEKELEEYLENDENDINLLTFKADGTFSAYNYEVDTLSGPKTITEETSTGTYSTDENKLIIIFDEEDEDEEGTFSSTYLLNGDNLRVKTTTSGYTDFNGDSLKTIVTRNLERIE